MMKRKKVLMALFSLCVLSFAVACDNGQSESSGNNSEVNSSNDTILTECSHEYVEDTTHYVAPTCSTLGEKYFACTKCESVKRETIAKLSHSEVELLDEFDADCINQGYKVYACLECGENYATYTEAKGHTPDGNGTVYTVGCLTDGYTEYQCKECDETYKANWTVRTGHSYGDIAETVEATCSHIGYTVKICQNCGDRLEEKTEGKLSHDFSKGNTCGVCSVGKEAIWVTYGGNLDTVEYADGTYIINSAKDEQILHIEAEAVCSLMENGCDKITVAFDNKDNQSTAFNAQYNGVDNAYNIGFNFSISLTGEMKTEGIDIMMYYHTRGWSADVGKDETDGFKFSITGIKAFNEADKTSWFVCDNMDVVYDEANESWIFTPNSGTLMEGYHHPCFSLAMIEKYKAEGKTKLTLTVGTVNNAAAAIQFDIPKCSAANIGASWGPTTVEIDLNNLPTNQFIDIDGYFAMRCYVNAEIEGLVITVSVS